MSEYIKKSLQWQWPTSDADYIPVITKRSCVNSTIWKQWIVVFPNNARQSISKDDSSKLLDAINFHGKYFTFCLIIQNHIFNIPISLKGKDIDHSGIKCLPNSTYAWIMVQVLEVEVIFKLLPKK